MHQIKSHTSKRNPHPKLHRTRRPERPCIRMQKFRPVRKCALPTWSPRDNQSPDGEPKSGRSLQPKPPLAHQLLIVEAGAIRSASSVGIPLTPTHQYL